MDNCEAQSAENMDCYVWALHSYRGQGKKEKVF